MLYGIARTGAAQDAGDPVRRAEQSKTPAQGTSGHEIGHQWWGSAIVNKNFGNYWFVESLAEYSSALCLEAVRSENGAAPDKGYAAYLDHVDGWRRTILDTPMVSSVQDASYLWSNGGYQAAVYNKGPYAMHILRMTFGYDKTVEFLRTLAQDLGNQEIVTTDIQRIAERMDGEVLGPS